MIQPTLQISLDVTSIPEALVLARHGIDAGFDWLEAGTPLIIAEGMHGVKALRVEFPNVPIVADLKTMDGGYLEAEMMAKAGASMVVVMGVAHEATVRAVVAAGRDFGVKVMGDDLAAPDKVACVRQLEALGVDYIIHHVGFDERRLVRGISPLDELDAVVRAVRLPVQAVGGLTLEQAVEMPRRGAPLVVIGAPLAIDGESFRAAQGAGGLSAVLREIVRRVKQQHE